MPGVSINPTSAWVEVQSATVEVDGTLEGVRAAVAAGAVFDGHDLAVVSLGDGGGLPICTSCQRTAEPAPE